MDIAISLLGGLGLFLFGMSYMGDGLQKAAGSKMKDILAALTKNKLMGVLVGALVTGVIQSSSATTVMVVGFVNAGLMNLNQAVGIIMGANIGTTVTAFLVSLNITKLATFLVGVGVIVYMVAKKRRVKSFAEVIIGFGILFIGMDIMKTAIEPLQSNPQFTGLMTKFSNPIFGILVGFVMTAILQSSSATTGILIAVAATGVISFDYAYPIVFGQNIGTCVTALLASIGANKTAKRAAVIHLLFNVTGTLSDMPKSKNRSNTIENGIASIDEIEQTINQDIDKLLETRTDIENKIDDIIDLKLREIMKCRYLDFKTYEQIAVDCNYCYQQVIRIHETALNLIKL